MIRDMCRDGDPYPHDLRHADGKPGPVSSPAMEESTSSGAEGRAACLLPLIAKAEIL